MTRCFEGSLGNPSHPRAPKPKRRPSQLLKAAFPLGKPTRAPAAPVPWCFWLVPTRLQRTIHLTNLVGHRPQPPVTRVHRTGVARVLQGRSVGGTTVVGLEWNFRYMGGASRKTTHVLMDAWKLLEGRTG
eukprot:scaffold24_cov341-Pavlova_lutheri.AAC.66